VTKKHMTGFSPIPFNLAGKILIAVGLILVVIGGFDYLFNWELIPLQVFFFGIGLFILGLYLFFVVPKES